MKGKKKKLVWCLLFTVLLSITGPLGNTEDYQAADVYTNAMEFFFATGDIDDKHIDIVDGTIYFGTRAKLAHTYASGHKYYRTLGYDVTMSAGGKSLTFSVKRGGSLSEVPGADKVDSSGYQYLLYKIPTRKIMELAELADPTNAATVLAASEIKVRMDAIVTVRQNGLQGSIVEDGKGGITENEANGPIYHLKNASELEEMMGIFPGHKFISYYNIVDYLKNYKLTNYYNVGPATVGNTSYTKGTYSGNSNMLFQNGSIYNKEKSTLLQEFKLMNPGTNGLKLNFTGYHLDAGEEWKKSDGTLMSISKTYMPKEVEPSVGFGDRTLVLYANWKPNTYYVEYNANGGTGTMSKTTATYDKEFTLTKNAFSRTGYKFIGWATSANSKTVVYTDQKTVSNLTSVNGGTVKLYAVWQEEIYTVTLDSTTPMNKAPANAGTKNYFEKYNVGFYKEKECTTSINTITKPSEPGYIFEGYYSGKEGAGTQHIDGNGKINPQTTTATTFTSNKTLYAKWKPIEYTIQYNANGGTGTMADTPMTYDKEEYLRSNTFTLTGYKFMGWATSRTGSVVYEDRETVINLTTEHGKVIELFAVWEPNIYTIDLNNDGADSAGTAVYYEKYDVGNYGNRECTEDISTITKPEKKGYTFGGYYTSREGKGDSYVDVSGEITSKKNTFTANKTLYAYWIPHNYTIKYDANDENVTDSMEDTSATYDVEVTLRACTFQNPGKNFVGWATSKTGSVVYGNRATVLNLTDIDGGEVTLYAVWSENIYTITLNSDGAEVKGTESYYEKYGVGNYKDSTCTGEISVITLPQKKGFVFGGYYTGKNGTGTQYIDATGKITASPTTFTTNKTLYAKWTITGYTIRYDGNGGIGSMDDTPAVYNQSVSLSPNGFLNPGNSFDGWSLTRDGEVLFKDKSSVRNLNTVDGEIVTLYAVWKKDVYTITLNSDGAEVKGTECYYEKFNVGNYKDNACTLTISTIIKPTWTGKTFGGYYSGKDGTGDQYIDAVGKITASATTFTSDITLYAKWIPNKYMIYYDANGGTGTMLGTMATYGKAESLSPCTFTNTGKTFVGWSITENGAVRYADKETVRNLTLDASITLYAVWKPNVYTITLNNDGGETKGTECYFEKYGVGNYKDSSCTQNISTITKPTWTGKTFGGYYTGRDGTGGEAYINSAGTIIATNTTFTEHTTLYAYWITNGYTIQYNANGGEGTMDDTDANCGESVTLSLCTFTKMGHTFKGWSTRVNGPVTYKDRDSVKDLTTETGKIIVLYAVWEPDVYTITLNNDGGETQGTAVYYQKYGVGNYQDSACTQTITTIVKPTWAGKTFGGYYTGRDGSGSDDEPYINSAGVIKATNTTFTEDTTLYAYWITNEYTIRYNANGGDGTMADTPATCGETVTLSLCTFTNTGKTFKGWSTRPAGTVQYVDRDSVKDLAYSGTVVLYAIWEPNIYTITLNNDGGETAGTAVYYQKYGVGNYADSTCIQSISTITKPTWDGKTFGGYYTARDGTGDSYINAAGMITALNTTFTKDTMLYAKWTTNTYTIRYNANGGTGTMADTDAICGEMVTLRLCTFTNTGKSFKGWSTRSNGSVEYVDRASVKDLANSGTVVLYAVWEPDVYTITLNNDGGETKGTESYYEKYGVGNYVDSTCTETISTIIKPTLEGKTFGGYYTGRNGKGTQYINASGKITAYANTFTEHTTLYAKWITNTYTIRYNTNGGTGTMDDTAATYGEFVTLRLCTFTRAGHTFKGWSTKSNGPVEYVDRASVKNLAVSGTVMLYAVWEPFKVEISLDHQGGTSDMDVFYELYGNAFYSDSLFSNIILQITKPVMTGFTFKGYFAGSMGSGNPLVNEYGSISVPNTTFLKDTTLFAKWMPKTYTITLDRQGGKEGSTSVTAIYKKMLPYAQAPQKPGYLFKGYFTETGGNGTKFYDAFMDTDIVYMQEKNMTVYAHWVDEFAPQISLTANPEKWTNQKVTLTAHASDDGSGLSGIVLYEIASDDSLIQVASATGLNGAKTKELAFENTKEGVVRYKAVATDMAGNTAESYSTAYYDTTAPEGTLTFDINGTVISIELDITDINMGN